MRIVNRHAEVVIVGAGPSGLMMAAQLLRNGIQPIIIDAGQGPTSQSKALAIQSRTVEILRQMGLADHLLSQSIPAEGLIYYQQTRQVAQLNFSAAAANQLHYPHIYLHEQSKTERLLLDELTRQCCPVYWNTQLLNLQETAAIIQLELENDNQPYTLTCNWLIGADGAHSTVRNQLQILFEGDSYPHQFYLADVQLANANLTHRHLQLYQGDTGFATFFPIPGDNFYRVIGNIPAGLTSDNLKLQQIEPFLQAVTGFALQVTENRWFTTYRLHHRMAAKFSQRKCFLIGDAAHIHSPVGGQGMNTGLQDAYNLAWKLSGVINQHIEPQVLSTYADERMPVALQLLKTTDKAFNLITSSNIVTRFFKNRILPRILAWAQHKSKYTQLLFKRVSQTDIQYRNSRLSLHLSQTSGIRAGDRLPYLKIYDEKKQQETDLHAWCSKPGFTLITIGPLTEQELFTFAKWITQSYTGKLNFFHLPPSVKNQQVFDAFEIKIRQVKAMVVRPDMHIGLLSDTADITTVDNYLRNVAGMKG
ncbi:FAD-dependent monooxygenase [Mucilaginibacter sp.]